MKIIFLRDTELVFFEPPFSAYFESGDKFEVRGVNIEKDMVNVNHPIYGHLSIFNEDIIIS